MNSQSQDEDIRDLVKLLRLALPSVEGELAHQIREKLKGFRNDSRDWRHLGSVLDRVAAFKR